MLLKLDVIERAATIVKVVRLAGSPGMDEVAVKLNMEPTYDELRVAKMWAKALELAKDNKSIFILANELHKATKYG